LVSTPARCARANGRTSWIDPAGLDRSVDGYHEEEVAFYGGLRRMVNRNDAAVVATGVGGAVVFRDGQFRDGYGKTVKSGRYLRAGARHAAALPQSAAVSVGA
jgi:N-acyl-D-aspartate/D-glutamate deacylase